MKKKELSVWQFVAGKSSYYEECKYVCMDDKNKVAVGTDREIMFVNPDEYIKYPYEYANDTNKERGLIIVDKEGKPQEYGFPYWKSIIPPKDKREAVEFLDDAIIKARIKEVEAFISWEVNKRFKRKDIVIYLCAGVWMPLDKVKKMLAVGLDGWFKRKQSYFHSMFKEWDGKTMAVSLMYGIDYKENEALGFIARNSFENDFNNLYKLYKETIEIKNKK